MGKRIPFPCTAGNCGDLHPLCGQASTYNKGCRCAACSKAKSDRDKERRAAMRRDVPHPGGPCTPENCGSAYKYCGKVVTYLDRQCRCDPCREAKSDAGRRRRLRIAADPTRWCSYPSCGRPRHSHELCAGHVFQLKMGRNLTPLRPQRKSSGGAWTKEEMLAVAVPDGECLLFGLHQASVKYGVVTTRKAQTGVKSKSSLAHRHMYSLCFDDDITNRTVHHTCGKAKCINPDHLQLASRAENTLEMLSRRDYESEIAMLKLRVAELEHALRKKESVGERACTDPSAY